MSDLQITELKTRRTVLQGLLAETDDAIERATKRQRREDDRGFKPTRPIGMYFNFQGAKIKELMEEQPLAAEQDRIAYARDIAAYNDV
jgi:hypothetical protein